MEIHLDTDAMMYGLTGELKRSEPMSRHTSWRTGGTADWFYKPDGKRDLSKFLERLPPDVPITWFGLGSNSLVRDGGYRGVIISTLKGLAEIRTTGSHRVFAAAGVTCPKLARFATHNALCGAEFMVGIPGTVGGALAMNAGCFGSETWPIVTYAETIDIKGKIRKRDASDVDWGYRHCQLNSDEWFVGAEFALSPCEAETSKRRMKNYLKQRSLTQPIQSANAGSVFRNPPGDYAARLLETAGLKNYSIGAARISDKHANFIVNRGDATAREIEELIQFASQKVESVHGIKLELEVRIFGTEA